MKKDIKYIIKRVLIGILIILIMSFINSCEVHAESYSFQDYDGTIYFNPAGHDITNTRQNSLYYNSYEVNPASIKSFGNICGNDTHMCDTLSTGTFLVDIYIYGVGTFYSSYNAYEFTSNFGWSSATDGTWFYDTGHSKSAVIEVRKDYFSNIDALHLLVRWDINDPNGGGVGRASFQITKYNFWTHVSSGSNVGYSIGGIFDYSPQIIEDFRNGVQLSNITNAINQQSQQQHQDSLNEQQAINDVNTSINDSSIPSDSSSKINNITSTITANQNSSIVQIATFFPQVLQLIINGMNTNCTGGYSLGSLYGTELTIPCINPVDYLGATMWGTIDAILCLCYLIPLCKFLVNKYNDLTSMQNLRWQ